MADRLFWTWFFSQGTENKNPNPNIGKTPLWIQGAHSTYFPNWNSHRKYHSGLGLYSISAGSAGNSSLALKLFIRTKNRIIDTNSVILNRWSLRYLIKTDFLDWLRRKRHRQIAVANTDPWSVKNRGSVELLNVAPPRRKSAIVVPTNGTVSIMPKRTFVPQYAFWSMGRTYPVNALPIINR